MYVKTDTPPKRCSKCPRYEAVFKDDTYSGFFCNSISSGKCNIDNNTGRLKQCPLIVGRAVNPEGPRPKREDVMGDGHTLYRRAKRPPVRRR